MKGWPSVWLALLLVLVGCSLVPAKAPELDDIPADKVAEIDALPEVPGEPLPTQVYVDLGMVEGISCQHSRKEPSASWDDAVRRTKFRAIKKGANAIANLSCETPRGGTVIGRWTSTFMNRECIESIRCTASAVKR